MNETRLRELAGFAAYRAPVVAISLLFYVPILAIVVFSFWTRSGLWMEPALSLDAYRTLFSVQGAQLVQSFQIGILVGVIALVMAFPIAYLVTFVASDFHRMIILSIFAIPFFVSIFVRNIMWIPILGRNGVVNSTLITLGLIDEPLGFLLFSNTSLVIGALAAFMPFVIFTGWLAMQMIDEELLHAASDLGARPLTVIRTIVVPLSLAGLSVGVLFVIAASMGESIFPLVLGGADAISIGLMTQRSFSQLNVPLAAAANVISIGVYVLALIAVTRFVDLSELFEVQQ
ncbi:MAG: ABC transporter permease [Halobacteriota archaeon]|uniref:ABC transporter permease n=1 Tax=Natronomonas sp. TaxID=2184060 RepID=UPI00397613C5